MKLYFDVKFNDFQKSVDFFWNDNKSKDLNIAFKSILKNYNENRITYSQYQNLIIDLYLAAKRLYR